jgi:hypothetical protein
MGRTTQVNNGKNTSRQWEEYKSTMGRTQVNNGKKTTQLNNGKNTSQQWEEHVNNAVLMSLVTL